MPVSYLNVEDNGVEVGKSSKQFVELLDEVVADEGMEEDGEARMGGRGEEHAGGGRKLLHPIEEGEEGLQD